MEWFWLGFFSGVISMTLVISLVDPGLPPCGTEDSSNCIWDAEKYGNGEGKSFIEYEGSIYYKEKK